LGLGASRSRSPLHDPFDDAPTVNHRVEGAWQQDVFQEIAGQEQQILRLTRYDSSWMQHIAPSYR